MNEQLLAILGELGIAPEYPQQCGMPLQDECPQLVDVGLDAFERPARLEANTAQAWYRMQCAAADRIREAGEHEHEECRQHFIVDDQPHEERDEHDPP